MQWWLWAAQLGDSSGAALVYALLAPSGEAEVPLETVDVALGPGKVLFIRQGVISATAGRAVLERLEAGTIDLRPAGLQIASTQVRARRETLDLVLGDPAATLTAHYGLPDVGALAKAAGGLSGLLQILEEHLGLPFRERLKAHLGNLDVVTFGNDPPEPAIATDVEPAPRRLIVRRRAPWSGARQWAHLHARNRDESLEDVLFELPAGEDIVEHPLPPDVGSFAVRIFPAAGGRRIFWESATLVRRIDVNGRVRASELRVQDPLTSRMASAPKEVRQRAEMRSGYGSFRTRSEADDGRIDAQLDAIAALLGGEAPDSVDRFFERTLVDEIGVIEHLNALMDGGRLRRAVLVDPFFGEEAFSRLVMRLESHDLELVVVTSWAAKHPDTAERLPGDSQQALDNNVRRLRALLDRVRPLVPPRLTVRNLVHGSEQAFHDRYLLLEAHEGGDTIYLLSNSINNMAANWPFCMAAIGGRAGERAAAYVKGLAAGEDITAEAQPVTNFLWPEPT